MKTKILLSIFVFLIFLTSSAYAFVDTVSIMPENPTDSDDLYCLADGYRAGDYFHVKWYKNFDHGNVINEGNDVLSASKTSPGEHWECEIFSCDPDLNCGSEGLSNAVLISAESPDVCDLNPLYPTLGQTEISTENAQLIWECNNPSARFDVFIDAGGGNVVKITSDTYERSATVPWPLDCGTFYHWSVVAKTGTKTQSSDDWFFVTRGSKITSEPSILFHLFGMVNAGDSVNPWTFKLKNEGECPIDWNIIDSRSWTTFSPSSGTLQPHTSKNVKMSITSTEGLSGVYFLSFRVNSEEPKQGLGLLIVNNPPSITKPVISPQEPITTDDLACTYTYSDPENQEESGTQYKWWKKAQGETQFTNQNINSKTLGSDHTTRGDQWKCSVKPKDGYVFGEEKTSSAVTVINAPPVWSTVPKQQWLQNTEKILDLSNYVHDPDGDDITFSDGSSLNHISTGYDDYFVTFTPENNWHGTEQFKVKADDGYDTSDSNVFDLIVVFVNQKPEMTPLSIQTMIGEPFTPIDLTQYSYDLEDWPDDLSYAITSQSNPNIIYCSIDDKWLRCDPATRLGTDDLTIRVTDSGGLHDSAIFSIVVSDNAPMIDSMSIDPVNPDKDHDLFCNVKVSDSDGDLDYIVFNWYRNLLPIRTNQKDAYGSSFSTNDVLENDHTNSGDLIFCDASVYDKNGNSNTAGTFVIIKQSCSLDIRETEITGNTIKSKIKNDGALSEVVDYEIYVDDVLIKNDSIELDADGVYDINTTYDFSPGTYHVEINATSDCGAEDSSTITHYVFDTENYCENPFGYDGETRCDYDNQRYLICQDGNWITHSEYCTYCPDHCGDGVCNCDENETSCYQDCYCDSGYLDQYRCKPSNSDIRQRKYRYSNCSTVWKDIEVCEYGCEDGVCLGEEEEDVTCGLSIKYFSYNHTLHNTYRITPTVRVKNIGEDTEKVNISLTIDNKWHAPSFLNIELDPDESVTRTFYFDIPTAGTHTLVVQANSTCGAEDSMTGTVTIYGTGCEEGYLNEYKCHSNGKGVLKKYRYSNCSYAWINWQECEYQCSNGECIEAPMATNVEFNPHELDICLQCTRLVSARINSSEPQEFRMSVQGLPADWISYDASKMITKNSIMYVYITGKQLGHYNITVTVTATDEDIVFSETIPIFVATPSQEELPGLLSRIAEAIQNFFQFFLDDVRILATVLIVITVIILLFGAARLREEGIFS